MQRLRLQRALNEALLAEAIVDAEQRCDRLARGLAAFDRRASLRVNRLRANGSVRESLVWNPSAARTPDAPDSSPPQRRATRERPRWALGPAPASQAL